MDLALTKKNPLACIIVVFLCLQIVDSTITTWSVKYGIAGELNPIAASMVKTWWNIPLKVIPSLLTCLLIVRIVEKRPLLRKAFTFGLVIYATLMALVVANNILQVILHYTVI